MTKLEASVFENEVSLLTALNLLADHENSVVQNQELLQYKDRIAKTVSARKIGGNLRIAMGVPVVNKVNAGNFFIGDASYGDGRFILDLSLDRIWISIVGNAVQTVEPVTGAGVFYNSSNTSGSTLEIGEIKTHTSFKRSSKISLADSLETVSTATDSIKFSGKVDFVFKGGKGSFGLDTADTSEETITVRRSITQDFSEEEITEKDVIIPAQKIGSGDKLNGYVGWLNIKKTFDFFQIIEFDGRLNPAKAVEWGPGAGPQNVSEIIDRTQRRFIISGNWIDYSQQYVNFLNYSKA